MVAMTVNETVPFRVFKLPCCGHRLCWVQRKYPMYCPQCGKHVYIDICHGEHTETSDDNAWMKYRQGLWA